MSSRSSPRRDTTPAARIAELPGASGPADEELVRRARSGDTVARGLLYRRHARGLINFACRLLGDSAEADDLVQDTFVRCFEKLPELRADAAFVGWLRQIALREAQRRFRRARLVARLGLVPSAGPFLSSARSDLSVELREIERVLAGVPVRACVAWVSMCIEGFSLDEVSEALGCSRSTIKRDLAEVRAAIAARFPDADGDEEAQ